MYGKHFASMYTGSMVGAGSAYYAVWGYVIAHMRPDKEIGMQVELNPAIIATVLGEKQEVVLSVIERMCSPDPKSRSKEEEGKKLVRLGEYDYRVVNGPKYRKIMNEEDRRESNRQRQKDWRDKQKAKKLKSKPLNGEVETIQKLESGEITQEEADAVAATSREF